MTTEVTSKINKQTTYEHDACTTHILAGTAITSVLARKGHRVTIVLMDCQQASVDSINRTHRNPEVWCGVG